MPSSSIILSTTSTVQPNFYSKNTYYIGRTLIAMGRKKEGQEWLKRCLAMPAHNADDREAHDMAIKYLSS